MQTLSRIFPKDALLWKLEMLKSAIASVDSYIYSVRADTLLLFRSYKFLCFIGPPKLSESLFFLYLRCNKKILAMTFCSGHDQWLLNEQDIERYYCILPNCIVRKLDDSGQFPLLVSGIFSLGS